VEVVMGCTLEDITLTVTWCDTHTDQLLVSTKDHRQDFSPAETVFIEEMADQLGLRVRWYRQSIPDHAHVHLER
jgi:hypothetical protein